MTEKGKPGSVVITIDGKDVSGELEKRGALTRDAKGNVAVRNVQIVPCRTCGEVAISSRDNPSDYCDACRPKIEE